MNEVEKNVSQSGTSGIANGSPGSLADHILDHVPSGTLVFAIYFAIIYLWHVQMIVSPNVPDGTFPVPPSTTLSKSRNSLAVVFQMEQTPNFGWSDTRVELVNRLAVQIKNLDRHLHYVPSGTLDG